MYIIWIVPGHNKQRQQTSFFVMTKRFFAKRIWKISSNWRVSTQQQLCFFSNALLTFVSLFGNDCNFLWLKSGKVDFLPLSDGKLTCICFTVLFYINGKSQKLIESSNRMSEGKITSRINSSQLEKTFKNYYSNRLILNNNKKNSREKKI